VARHRVPVIEMRILSHVEGDGAARVETHLRVAVRLDLLDGPKFAVGDVPLPVRRGELHAVSFAERALGFPVERHPMQPAWIVAHSLAVLAFNRDEMDGTTRFTFVRLEGKTVTAFVVVAQDGAIEGKPCFAIGYAVPEAYRNQGRAKEIVRAALAEMQGAFRRLYPEFYVVAIVGADNKFSQRVAEQTISNTPVTMTDKISGLPALKYVRKIRTSTAR
jgi:RimJ/RimL family protein N-acetyltransferase